MARTEENGQPDYRELMPPRNLSARDGQGAAMDGQAPAAVSPLTFTTPGIPPQARPSVLHAVAEQGLVPIVPLPDITPRVHLAAGNEEDERRVPAGGRSVALAVCHALWRIAGHRQDHPRRGPGPPPFPA